MGFARYLDGLCFVVCVFVHHERAILPLCLEEKVHPSLGVDLCYEYGMCLSHKKKRQCLRLFIQVKPVFVRPVNKTQPTPYTGSTSKRLTSCVCLSCCAHVAVSAITTTSMPNSSRFTSKTCHKLTGRWHTHAACNLLVSSSCVAVQLLALNTFHP